MHIAALLLAALILVGAAAWASGSGSKAGNSSGDLNWEQVIQVSKLISESDVRVQNAIKYAMGDADILNEHSSFYKKSEEEFGRRHMGWVNEDLSLNEVPPAVFKTVLFGYGYMGYLDWKNIYEPEEALHAVAVVLERPIGKEVSKSVWVKQAKELESVEDENHRANLVVKEMATLAEQHGYQLVWFDEGGDSYAFFAVSSSVAEQLENVELDTYHKFKPAPKF
ncbi:hypothetical protein [Microbulbifer aggregans]|uniref:DUF6630 family protein n=1 Tax=Microbulbifer aggregans TaxID=1769779 RepID=UPI001CFE7E89|nr:hypothetical protein [Microbulbifer aggregans]